MKTTVASLVPPCNRSLADRMRARASSVVTTRIDLDRFAAARCAVSDALNEASRAEPDLAAIRTMLRQAQTALRSMEVAAPRPLRLVRGA